MVSMLYTFCSPHRVHNLSIVAVAWADTEDVREATILQLETAPMSQAMSELLVLVSKAR